MKIVSVIIFILLQTIINSNCHESQYEKNQHPKRFTIQFSSPLSDIHAVKNEQDRFLDYLKQHNISDHIRVRYRYSDIMNGMSIEVLSRIPAVQPESDPISVFIENTLSKCPLVNRYWSGKRYHRPNAIQLSSVFKMTARNESQFLEQPGFSPIFDTGSANLQYAHSITGVDIAHSKGWFGQGIKVGILDTGIDYMHPSLGGCYGKEGCIVRYGSDLVGDSYGPEKELQPDDDPIDICDGHGTHIAGIIAANDSKKGFIGVAPGVTLGAWRIFGCNGDTEDDIIIAAAEMAAKAGMDIINISVGGGSSSWEEEPLAVAMSNLANRGVMVVVAQGNEGLDGIARTPSPAIGKNVISVASVDNGKRFSRVIQVFDGTVEKRVFEYILSMGQTFTSGGPPIPFTILSETDIYYGCEPIFNNFTGFIVVARKGGCHPGIKAQNIQNMGGVGVLFYGEPDEDIQVIELSDYKLLNIPVISINSDDGRALVELHKSFVPQLFQIFYTTVATKLTLQFSSQMVDVKTFGKPSSFSTWGPDPELHFKPDITAVGGYIFSTYPLSQGGYATLSGTSMATPYLSGCLAIFMQATKERDTTRIMTRLSNFAQPVLSANGSFLESPIKQGPGLVQVYNSIIGSLIVEPPNISLNDTENFLGKTFITMTNTSPIRKTYFLQNLPSIGINGYNFSESAVPMTKPTYYVAQTDVLFAATQLTLEPNQPVRLEVQFTKPEKPDNITHLIYGGYIKISGDNEVISIPYYGALGAQKELPILDRAAGYPFIGDENGNATQGETLLYDFSKLGQVLHLYSRIGSPTSYIKYQLISSEKTGELIGDLPLQSNHYIARNDHSTKDFDYVFNWKGKIIPLSDSDVGVNSSKKKKPLYDIYNRSTKEKGKKGNDRPKLIPAPVGSYRIRISALKIFGNPSNSKDWEVWHSPVFQIKGQAQEKQ